MHRVIVFYDQAPDPDSYAEHVEICKQVPNGVFRHGPVTGSPMGEPQHAYFAEWEFPDADAFQAAGRSPEFVATGKDAQQRGLPKHFVEFVELS